MVDRTYMKYSKYAYRELIKKDPADEVDRSHKEVEFFSMCTFFVILF